MSQYIRYPASGGGGSGDVVGPASATDDALVRFDGTTGKLIKDSSVIVDDSGNLETPGDLTAGNFSGDSSGTNTGDVTLAAVGSAPNANAATLTGQALNLQPADGTNPGVLTAGAQTIGGAKTFSSTIAASNFSGSSSGTNTGDVTLTAVGSSPAAAGASLSGQALTLQPADGTNPGVVTAAAQTIAGAKTFSTAPILSSLTASRPLKLDGSKNVTSALIDLASASDVTGTLPVGNGGTGQTTLTNHGVLVGAAASGITALSAAGAGTVLGGVASSDPAFTATPTLGVAGATLGTLALAGNTSGTITIQPQAAAGTYNFNLPTSAGSAGQPLLSGGGVGAAQTYGTLGVAAGGTGQTSYTDGQLLIGNSSGNTLTKATLTQGSGITITNGNGSITIAASGGATVTNWASFTPTGTWNTNVTYTGFWRQVGDNIEVQVLVSLSGAPNATGLAVNLPSGKAFDTAKLANTNANINVLLGNTFIRDDSTGGNFTGVVAYNDSDTVSVRYSAVSGALIASTEVTATAPVTFAASDFVQIWFVGPLA